MARHTKLALGGAALLAAAAYVLWPTEPATHAHVDEPARETSAVPETSTVSETSAAPAGKIESLPNAPEAPTTAHAVARSRQQALDEDHESSQRERAIRMLDEAIAKLEEERDQAGDEATAARLSTRLERLREVKAQRLREGAN